MHFNTVKYVQMFSITHCSYIQQNFYMINRFFMGSSDIKHNGAIIIARSAVQANFVLSQKLNFKIKQRNSYKKNNNLCLNLFSVSIAAFDDGDLIWYHELYWKLNKVWYIPTDNQEKQARKYSLSSTWALTNELYLK